MDKEIENLLTICCLGYNHGEFLKENLDSIKRIDYPYIEVIIVDDGSSDDSVTQLKEIKKDFPFELKIIAQKNTGNIGKNFNNALAIAKGSLVTFIALDDVFNSKVILQEIKKMNANSNLAFIASNKAVAINDEGYIDHSLPDTPIRNIKKPSVQELLEFEYSNFGSFYVQGSIFRKSIIDEIGGFDESMTGDDIVLRTKLFRYMIHNEKWDQEIIDENNVFYRQHGTNISKNSIRQIRIVTEYLDKYWKDREDPQILIDWVVFAIRTNKFSQYSHMFTFNERADNLSKNPIIRQEIEKSLAKEKEGEKTPISKFFFKKEKLNNTRNITILGFLNFSYSKKIEPSNSTHYLDLE